MMSSSTPKRSRACDHCHSIKIKCELGSTPNASPPCERCVRLNKNCTVSVPKRQKDRVAELEAEVEALRRLLDAQRLGEIRPSDQDLERSRTIGNSAQNAKSKKRRLEPSDHTDDTGSDAEASETPTFRLGHLVNEELQLRLLNKYRNDISPMFPLIPVPTSWDLETLRTERPFVLEAIIYAVCPGVVTADAQEEIAKVFMTSAAKRTIASGEKSLELVQAIHIAVLYYRTPEHHRTMPALQLLQLSHGVAVDMGIGGPLSTPWLGIPFESTDQNILPADGWRAWLTCHILTSTMSILLRRPNAEKWTDHHRDCLLMLGFSSHGTISTDLLLCQFIRAERLCEQIADELELADMSTVYDVSDMAFQMKMQKLRALVWDWQIQLPVDLRLPSVIFFQHVATLYLNEAVLHTATNKQSFAAPYVAERLSISDYPAPLITTDHITSINAMKTSVHALLDIVIEMDLTTTIALPGFIFTSRVAYACSVLNKLYVATTASGNTFGSVISPEELKCEYYFAKLVAISAKVDAVDHRSGVSRILSATVRLQEWHSNYKAMLASTGSTTSTLPSSVEAQLVDMQFPTPSSSSHTYDGWDEFLTMSDEQDFYWGDMFGMTQNGDALIDPSLI